MSGKSRWVVAAFALASATAAAAVDSGSALQPIEGIQAVVRGFLEEQNRDHSKVEVAVGEVDPRLRLSACEQPLETYLPSGSRTMGSTLVGVRCRGEKPWSLFVQATVAVKEPVVVSTHPLSRGAVVGPGDIALAERDLGRLVGSYLTDPAPILGKTMTRSISEGTALATNMVESTKVVKRGDKVTIVARQSGFEVRMQGEALADAAQGESVRVRNSSSKRDVQGVVVAPGVIEVQM